MPTLFYLSESLVRAYQTALSPFSRCSRVDDRRVVSGVVYVIKHGLQWKDAPDEYGPHKPLYNRFVRWSKIGIFNKIFNKLANQTTFDGSLMLDSTHLKAHRTAASLLKKGFSTSHRSNKRRPEFKTSCRL